MLMMLCLPQKEDIGMSNNRNVGAVRKLDPLIHVSVEANIGPPRHIGQLHPEDVIQGKSQFFQDELLEHRQPGIQPGKMVHGVRVFRTKHKSDELTTRLKFFLDIFFPDDGIVLR
mmetsp:Transcript_60798/g.68019  ORF Transcript_60798/g.68019 Transcript_60798/m.68019 type:complete len:115 (-) Transcript_60798:98-442(-)